MKKILIISPYFAPENTVASIRFTKIAKYLKQMGYSVTVLCSPNMMVDREDRILKDDCETLDHIFYIPPISINRIAKKFYSKVEQKNKGDNGNVKKIEDVNEKRLFKRLIDSKLYQLFLREWIYLMEIMQGQVFIRFYKKNKMEIGTFDYVISTYGPISSHILANYLKKKGLVKTWVADFRDVIYDTLQDKTRVVRCRKKNIAKMCINADKVTAITAEMLKQLEKYAEIFYNQKIHEKLYCISNGFDENDQLYLTEDPQERQLQISYCGTIYSNGNKVVSNPSPMFKAIGDLINEGKVDRRKITFNYAGRNSEVFCEIASNYGLLDRVVDHGFMERIASLNLQHNSDVILSLSWNTQADKGIMTGKIYEAFIVRKNVLCLISGDKPNSDLGKLIESTAVGIVWEEGNNDSLDIIKEWILKIYNEKMEYGEVKYCCNTNEVKKYSYEYLTRKFEKLLENN